MKHTAVALLVLLGIVTDLHAGSRHCAAAWRQLYHHDTNGKAIAGSKDALFDAIRRGYPIRISWGTMSSDGKRSVEHAAEPIFVTIMNASEVAAQLPEHIAQKSYWKAEEAQFDDPAVMWRGLMSTTGEFDAVWVNRATGAAVRRVPQRARIAWHAFAPSPSCEQDAAPDLRVQSGVVLRK